MTERELTELSEKYANLDGITTKVQVHMIKKALTETKGNITKAAKLLVVGRTGLYWKMKKLGINREDFF